MKNAAIMMFLIFALSIASAADKKKASPIEPPRPHKPSLPDIAHDFRGIALGITLSEFRKKEPVVSGQEQIRHEFVAVESVPVCTGDQAARDVFFILPNGMSEAGGVRCIWAYFNRDKYLPRYKESAAIVGGYRAGFYSFDFISKPGDAEPILYRMHFDIATAGFEVIMLGLKDKFGMPISEKQGNVQNRMGATFENRIAVWESTQSSIRVEQRFSDINSGMLEYELKDYADYANKLMLKAVRTKSKM